MQIAFHLGVHCTDEDRLLKCLLQNQAALAQSGIAVPQPARYRTIFRDTMAKLRGDPAEQGMQSVMLDMMIGEDEAERVVLSHEFFLAAPEAVVTEAGLFSSAHLKIAGYANLFPEAQCEFHMALRNPATLIPAMLSKMRATTYEDFMKGRRPADLRWGPVIARIVEENPGRKLTLWANEDTPLIWQDALRAVAGTQPGADLAGEHDFVLGLLTPEGQQALSERLTQAPPETRSGRMQLFSAALDAYARPDQLDMEVDLPGWDDELIDEVTALYEQDLDQISTMYGVDYISA